MIPSAVLVVVLEVVTLAMAVVNAEAASAAVALEVVPVVRR